MKKGLIIGLAVVLVMGLTLCLGTIALAEPVNEVYDEWDFDAGELTINTIKTGWSQNNFDSLHIDVDSGSSWGHQNAKTYDYGVDACHGRNFEFHREVNFDNGTVTAFTQRDNTAPWWPAYTEYYVESTIDEGSGFLGQDYSHSVYSDNMDLFMSAHCEYDMSAWEAAYNPWLLCGWDRPIDPDDVSEDWMVTEFGMGAEGDGSAELGFNFSHRPSHGDYLLGPTGVFGIDADVVDSAGFSMEAENFLDMDGYTRTSDIFKDFNVDWPEGGYFERGASGAWVILDGEIYGSD